MVKGCMWRNRQIWPIATCWANSGDIFSTYRGIPRRFSIAPRTVKPVQCHELHRPARTDEILLDHPVRAIFGCPRPHRVWPSIPDIFKPFDSEPAESHRVRRPSNSGIPRGPIIEQINKTTRPTECPMGILHLEGVELHAYYFSGMIDAMRPSTTCTWR